MNPAIPTSPQIWPLDLSIMLFVAAAAVITVFGIGMTRIASRLADLTGMGQAVMGAVFVGASTSLPEIVTSLTAAAGGHPDLAVGNAVGSISGQTALLAVADMAYRRANLEHAAASAANLMMGGLVIVLLSLPLLAMGIPRFALWHIHPASFLLILAYGFGIRLVSQTQSAPMWYPARTRETLLPRRAKRHRETSTTGLWLRFAVASAFMGAAGWVLARAGVSIASHTGLSETAVGGVLTGLSSSLPELITAVTAVRIGALNLAVADVLGGNAFDVTIVGLSDVAYRKGPIYGALSPLDGFLLALSILLTGILLMGMLRREKHGIANIGLESFLVLVVYAAAVAVLLLVR
ncbi:MAG TPA: sodium:calcium antiporter [Gammaproteobacteria bacterium]|nr:sodium:calcium antiporter [Gammaproteobacteria bacterium]